MTLNPASTGDFNGAWRVAGIGRQQYKLEKEYTKKDEGDAFKTISIGFDAPIKMKKSKFGLGLNVVSDKSGAIGYTFTKLTGSAALETKVANGQLRIGLQPTFVQAGNNQEKKIGDDDYAPDPENDVIWGSLGSFITDLDATKYFDLNAGIIYTKRLNKLKPVFGFSVFHIMRPKYTFFSSSDGLKMPMRFAYNILADYDFNSKISFHPNFQLMSESKAQNLVLGVNVGYSMKDKIDLIEKVFIGPEFRMVNGRYKDNSSNTNVWNNSDALIVIAGVKLPKWQVGVARDFTVFDLQGNYKRITGAWEVSIIYIAPDVNLAKKLIPCDRY